MKYLLILLVFLVGCATEAHGPYNIQSDDDQDCINSVGGKSGYCDSFRYPRGK